MRVNSRATCYTLGCLSGPAFNALLLAILRSFAGTELIDSTSALQQHGDVTRAAAVQASDVIDAATVQAGDVIGAAAAQARDVIGGVKIGNFLLLEICLRYN